MVDGVPFLIATGYVLGGRAETASSYLEYCLEKCAWSDFRFKPKSDAEGGGPEEAKLSLERVKGKLPQAEIDFLEEHSSGPVGSVNMA